MAKNVKHTNAPELANPLAIDYEEEEDILYLYFAKNRPAIAYDLTDKIIARVDPETNELVSVEVFDFRRDLRAKTPSDLPKDLVGAKRAKTIP